MHTNININFIYIFNGILKAFWPHREEIKNKLWCFGQILQSKLGQEIVSFRSQNDLQTKQRYEADSCYAVLIPISMWSVCLSHTHIPKELMYLYLTQNFCFFKCYYSGHFMFAVTFLWHIWSNGGHRFNQCWRTYFLY